jgi:transposase InsO family protein
MYEEISNFVKTCEKCQLRKKNRYEEPLHPTWSITVWEKVGVDVVYMPVTADGYGFIVFTRDDLSGWVEARALKNNTSLEVGTFLYEEVICRHGLPQKFVMDNGPENQDITKSLLEHYNIKNINISAYHPQSNGLVERGHGPVVNALAKYSAEKKAQWNLVLPLALWADRVTVRRSTGYSAFHLVYGRDCLLPVDFTVISWSLVDWNAVQETEDLLKARMRQLDERELAEARAAAELERSRRVNKDYFDQNKRLRPSNHQLSLGDLVLLFNSTKENSRERKGKLSDNWFHKTQRVESTSSSTLKVFASVVEILMIAMVGEKGRKHESIHSLEYQVNPTFQRGLLLAVRRPGGRSSWICFWYGWGFWTSIHDPGEMNPDSSTITRLV